MHFISNKPSRSWILFLVFSLDNTNHSPLIGALEVVYPVSSPDIGVKGLGNTEDILKYAIDLRSYGLHAEDINSFKFEVKSYRDTSVYLTDSKDFDSSRPFYNIYLGGSDNKWSAIRKRHQNVKFIDRVFGSHLNSSEFIPFWTSWSQGLIKFGAGIVVDNNILKQWQDADFFDVNGIGISTGYGASGEWKIYVNVSEKFDGFFNTCQRSNIRVESFVTLTLAIYKTECAVLCGKDSSCIGFNYNESKHRCELLSPPSDPMTDIPTVCSSGWEVNFKCYKGTDNCIGCFFEHKMWVEN